MHQDSDMDSDGESRNPVEIMRPPEFLPRTETLGGYIFVCNSETMQESLSEMRNLTRNEIVELHYSGLPDRYRDSVRVIRPGLPLFIYNYQTGQLHGVFEATSFGGTDINPSAWPDNNNPGKSRFPAQVRIRWKKISPPLEEVSFRSIVQHFTGNRFRLELTVPEAISLLDTFSARNQ